jgi:hypothetical protein
MPINFTNVVDLNNNRIQNVGAPALSSDAVTKQYVDNIATGLIWKDAVRVAASTNVSVSAPGAAIDGVTLAANDRVLLMGQTNNVENGIYVYSGTSLGRSVDADTNAELRAGTAVTVSEGTSNGNHTFVLITDGPIVVGTTGMDWALLNAGTAPVYTGQNGVDITNHVVTAVPAPNGGISVNGTGIGVIADPAGGLQVGNSGVATKLVANTALFADAAGLRFVPRTAAGLSTDANGAGVVLKANSGLAVDATGIQTVIAANKGLTVDATGLQVVSGNGITTDATGVKAVADPNGGLQVGSSGVATKLATPSGLSADSNGLTTVAAPTGGLSVGVAGLAVVPKPNSGIAVAAAGVSVVLRPNDGLDVDSTGIGITTDPAGGLATSATGLAVVARPNDGLDVDATGVGITTDPAGGLATAAAGLKAVQGLGILVGTDIKIDTTVVARRFAATVGDGVATSIPIVHSLNTRDVQVELYATAAPYDTVYAEVQRTDANTVTLLFGQAPTSGQYRAVVVG